MGLVVIKIFIMILNYGIFFDLCLVYLFSVYLVSEYYELVFGLGVGGNRDE